MSNTQAQTITSFVSRLHLPWPGRRHPARRAYEQMARQALSDIGLVSGASESEADRRFAGIVVLDPYVYPYADLPRLVTAGTFSQWLFFLDDQYDDNPALGRDPISVADIQERAFALLSGGPPPARPSAFDRLTLTLRARLLSHSSGRWQERFLRHVKEYLSRGSLPSMQYWARGETPALDDYLSMRMYDSAVFPALDMIELAAAIELPDEARSHPALLEMVDLAVGHIAYVNDLFSYQKEVLLHGATCNLVRVLMAAGATFEEAVSASVARINARAARFQELERTLPSFGPKADAAVRAYVAGMTAWMRGNVDFSLASRRYMSPDSPFLELRTPPEARHAGPDSAARIGTTL